MTPLNINIKLGLPKGRMQQAVFSLLEDAGVRLSTGGRTYRPGISLPNVETKILKPQNIVEMLAHGSRDLGFAGADWVEELEAEVIELLNTGLDPVSLVAAAPEQILVSGELPNKALLVATEYTRLTKEWIKRKRLNASVVRSFGATEVFPPEDADLIVDNSASGQTLKANNLAVIDEICTSSTRLYASPESMKEPAKREFVESFVLLLRSVLEARARVMLEVNTSSESLELVVNALPCMREATISPLHGDAGYAVKAAVPRKVLPYIIPEIKRLGGTDIVVTALSQIIP